MGGLFEIVSVITSPCINLCQIGEEGLCDGCARTLDEIACWCSKSPEWRAAVMAALPERTQRRLVDRDITAND